MKTRTLDGGPGYAGGAAFVSAGEFIRRISAILSVLLFGAVVYAVPPEQEKTQMSSSTSPSTPSTDMNGNAKPSGDPDENEWRFASRLTTLITYDDNIFIRATNKKDDLSLQIAPSFAFGIGNFRSEIAPYAPIPHFLARTGEEELPRKDFAYASYTPDVVLFATHHGEDAVNHDVRIAGREERELWDIQGQFHFQNISDTNIDVGRRIRQTYYTADGTGTYALTGKTSGSLEVYGNHSDYSGGFSSDEAKVTGFLAYQLAPKTSVGFGAAGGYLSVARGANQTYGQPLIQLKYLPTAKLSFTGQAGEEFRHFDGGVGNRSQFVFALSGDYAPSDGTNVTLSGRRETQSSAQYSGENIVATTYQGGVRQRFWQRNYLAVAGGFVRNDYENNQLISAVSRRDNYYFGKLSSSRDLTERGTVELAYEHRTNDSSAANFGFNENLVSLAASFLF